MVAGCRSGLVLAIVCVLVCAVPAQRASAAWSTPAALNGNADNDSGSDTSAQVATDSAGNWVAVWCSADTLDGTLDIDEDIFVSRSTDNGETWSASAALNTNAADDADDDRAPRDPSRAWTIPPRDKLLVHPLCERVDDLLKGLAHAAISRSRELAKEQT